MKELNFYGASDDLLECRGAICEEISCLNQPGYFHLKSAEGELKVVGTYLNDGTWALGVAPAEEDRAIPAWASSFSTCENGYSPILTLTVPDDTTLFVDEDI